jgi:hypothetical protein
MDLLNALSPRSENRSPPSVEHGRQGKGNREQTTIHGSKLTIPALQSHGKERHSTAKQGKAGTAAPYCLKTLNRCPIVSMRQANLKLEVFYEKQNPGFGRTRVFTDLVGFRHLCFGAGEHGQSGRE